MKNENHEGYIAPERMDRFTWQPGDLIVFKTEEEFLKYVEGDNRKFIKYENSKGDENHK